MVTQWVNGGQELFFNLEVKKKTARIGRAP